jgi:hypothetical protein
MPPCLTVAEEHSGKLKVTLGCEPEVLQAARGKNNRPADDRRSANLACADR